MTVVVLASNYRVIFHDSREREKCPARSDSHRIIEAESVLRRTAVGEIFWRYGTQPASAPLFRLPITFVPSTPVLIFLLSPLLDCLHLPLRRRSPLSSPLQNTTHTGSKNSSLADIFISLPFFYDRSDFHHRFLLSSGCLRGDEEERVIFGFILRFSHPPFPCMVVFLSFCFFVFSLCLSVDVFFPLFLVDEKIDRVTTGGLAKTASIYPTTHTRKKSNAPPLAIAPPHCIHAKPTATHPAQRMPNPRTGDRRTALAARIRFGEAHTTPRRALRAAGARRAPPIHHRHPALWRSRDPLPQERANPTVHYSCLQAQHQLTKPTETQSRNRAPHIQPLLAAPLPRRSPSPTSPRP